MNDVKRMNLKCLLRLTNAMVLIAAALSVGFFFTGCAMKGLDKTTQVPGQRAPVPAGRQSGDMQLAQAAPGSFPSPAEEIWVISRTRSISNPYATDVPGSGSMVVEDGGKRVPMPLKHTDVKAAISGYIATVKVTQQFQNPYDEKIEANEAEILAAIHKRLGASRIFSFGVGMPREMQRFSRRL